MTHARVSPRSTRLATWLAPACVLALLLTLPAPASALTRETVPASSEPSGLINISPITAEETVTPGTPTTIEVTIASDATTASSVRMRPVDLSSAQDPTLLAAPVENAEFGASEWIELEVTELEVAPFEKVTFDVTITPPVDAPVGGNYGAIEIEVGEIAQVDGQGGSGAQVRLLAIVNLLLTVPGEVVHDLAVEASVDDAYFLGGPRFVVYETKYTNDGTVTESIEGSIRITSLFGNTAAELPLRPLRVIRGDERTDRTVWSDPPAFGVFTATAEVRTPDGETQTVEIGRVVILPPWWVVALVVASLVLPPVYLWWRRRREWMLYLEDEDWDDLDEYDEVY